MSAVLALVASILLLCAAALLRAAGASLVRTPRADALHDAAEGDDRARLVADLLEDRPRLQPAIGTVHSGLLVAAAVPGAWALTSLASEWLEAPLLVLAAVVAIVAGDILPRSWGKRRPRRLAYRWSKSLARAVRLGNRATDFIVDDDEQPEEGDDAAQNGQEEEEMTLISSVLEFTDAIVREVMVPRPDMLVVPATSSSDDAIDQVMSGGRSRIPVTGEGVDDIVGILYAKDMLPLVRHEGPPKTVADLMRPAYFVPETKRVSELLREMQANQVHLAIVVDEFGGTAGLVTIEDIIEELVGEIVDEYDVEEPMVTPLDAGGYLIDARLHVDELEELLGLDVADDGWDTVGGLVLGLAGRVPREGESFDLEDFVLTADRVQGRRVARVRIAPR